MRRRRARSRTARTRSSDPPTALTAHRERRSRTVPDPGASEAARIRAPLGVTSAERKGCRQRERMSFDTRRLGARVDTLAPDQSEIRLLPGLERGALCHCTLGPGRTSLAVRHRTVEEIWFCLAGR